MVERDVRSTLSRSLEREGPQTRVDNWISKLRQSETGPFFDKQDSCCPNEEENSR